MSLFKSNWQYWDELLKRGRLASLLKDGAPRGIGARLVGFGYPFLLFIIVSVSVAILFTIPKKKLMWKTMAFSIAAGSVLGWVWGIWMLKADPVFPGWLFAPWAVIGKEAILTIEDWLFYPACTFMFFVAYRKVELKGQPWVSTPMYITIMAAYVALTLFFLVFSALAGRTIALMFAVPGMILFFYARDNIDLRKFLLFQVIVVGFEVVWDIFAVSLIQFIPGMSWAAQWIYITFDANGAYTHSNIFLDYKTHRWAWLLRNPVEITPWFGIVGGLLNYTMFAAGDKLFYGKSLRTPG